MRIFQSHLVRADDAVCVGVEEAAGLETAVSPAHLHSSVVQSR